MVSKIKSKILFTGGSGLLGGEVKKLLPKALYPTSKDFNVTNYSQIVKYLKLHKPQMVIHAAAFTSPPAVEQSPIEALEVNIIGTSNLAKACWELGIRMVYVCTDYVFKGDKGNYTEEDPVLPVNKYAWSKLGGECAVRLLNDYLIIRTSFGEKQFPYEKAFVDHFTSRESVDIVAKKIVKSALSGYVGVVHVGHNKRSVYQYAKALGGKNKIGKISIKDVKFPVPGDTSLNTAKYNKLFGKNKL